jgi:tetratricopeptide (TPR) repeat protein
LYRTYALFDSAAIFAEQLVEVSPTLEHHAKAGDVYYEAFSLALRPEKMKVLGEKSRFYFQKVLDENPARLDIKTKMGMTYISTDNPMAGIMMLREVLTENPNYVPAITNMGVLSLQSQQYERALERFDQLLALDSTNLQAHFYRAISLAELGKQEEAKAAFLYVKARESSPELLKTVDEYLSQLK